MIRTLMSSLTRRRLHAGIIVFVSLIATFSLMILRSKSAPAQPIEALHGDPVAAVAGALRIAVMIEGDGVYGAGIFLDPARGIVMTNQHVVQDMHIPRVATYDGRTATAAVIAVDQARDLAILSVPDLKTPDLPAPRLGDAMHLQPGEEVFAVGMPRKLPFTVSRGVVSYVGRLVDGERYLQMDMNINDGNSGGPVVAQNGDIVGMMSFIYRRAQGLSFALPTSEITRAFPNRVPVITPKL